MAITPTKLGVGGNKYRINSNKVNGKKPDKKRVCPECNCVTANGDTDVIVLEGQYYHLSHFIQMHKTNGAEHKKLSELAYAKLKNLKKKTAQEELILQSLDKKFRKNGVNKR